MSNRIKITLPEQIAEQLDELAAAEGEPVARVTARMVRERLFPAHQRRPACAVDREPRAAAVKAGRMAAAARVAPADVGRDRRPVWPRIPTSCSGLQQGWWNDTSQVETLCALVVWRDSLDDAGGDPREELDFQLNVAEFGRRLSQQGGGVTKAWTPGAPPDEWV